jgi:hypothetical protein
MAQQLMVVDAHIGIARCNPPCPRQAVVELVRMTGPSRPTGRWLRTTGD